MAETITGRGHYVVDEKPAEVAALVALVAHQQPLLALADHVADRDVGQHIGVVDAGTAGHRKEVGRQFRQRQLPERYGPRAAVVIAHLDVTVSEESRQVSI